LAHGSAYVYVHFSRRIPAEDHSTRELEHAIVCYINASNEEPKPLTADQILASVARFLRAHPGGEFLKLLRTQDTSPSIHRVRQGRRLLSMRTSSRPKVVRLNAKPRSLLDRRSNRSFTLGGGHYAFFRHFESPPLSPVRVHRHCPLARREHG
jgi:hypothetical protein